MVKWFLEAGLRRGYPLLQYLFLLCSEGFSAVFDKAATQREFVGISACRGGPMVSHLLFADDSILFCKASITNCDVIKRLLSCYEAASGQKVNITSLVLRSALILSKLYKILYWGIWVFPRPKPTTNTLDCLCLLAEVGR